MELIPARIIDEDLDRPELLIDDLDRLVDGCGVRHVHPHREGSVAGIRRRLDVARGNPMSLGGERSDDRAADAARSARYERDPRRWHVIGHQRKYPRRSGSRRSRAMTRRGPTGPGCSPSKAKHEWPTAAEREQKKAPSVPRVFSRGAEG